MGGNKLFLAVDGTFLLERVLERLAPCFEEIILAVGPDDEEPLRRLLGPFFRDRPVRIAVDDLPGRGPLQGFVSGMRSVRDEWAFVVGCDMPWIQEAVFRALWQAREACSDVLCASFDGYLEPLHAFYRRTCLLPAEAALASDSHRLKSFYDDVHVTVVDEESLSFLPGCRRSFQGLNTPQELDRLVNPL